MIQDKQQKEIQEKQIKQLYHQYIGMFYIDVASEALRPPCPGVALGGRGTHGKGKKLNFGMEGKWVRSETEVSKRIFLFL